MSALLGHHGLLLDPGVVGTLWTPANLSVAPKLWLDWDSPVTNVSGACSAWDNTQGSMGGSFMQATAANRPTINASALGGKRGLEFDGATDRLAASGGTLAALFRNTASAWSFVVAAQRSTGGANRQIFEASTDTTTTRFGNFAGTGTGAWAIAARRVDGSSAALLAAAPAANDTNFHLSYGHVNYATAAGLVSIDGKSPTTAVSFPNVGSGNTGNTDSVYINIGGNAANTTFGYMTIMAVISSSGNLPSSSDRERLEGWAAWQLGLTGNLPSGHSYKSSPPYV